MMESFMNWLADFSWTIETSIPSILLLGEYPYPNKEDYE